jgi:GDPmannose 4,6-dehydratase
LVAVDPRYFRPTEVDRLLGDSTKARQRFGWRPKHSFADIVREMVEADRKLVITEPRRFGALD